MPPRCEAVCQEEGRPLLSVGEVQDLQRVCGVQQGQRLQAISWPRCKFDTHHTTDKIFTVVSTSSPCLPGLYPEHVLPPRLLPRPSDARVDLPHLPRPRPARQHACHLPHCERRSPSDSPYTVPHLLQIEDAKNLVRRSKL